LSLKIFLFPHLLTAPVIQGGQKTCAWINIPYQCNHLRWKWISPKCSENLREWW